MSFLFPKPSAPPAQPTLSDPAVQAAALAEQQAGIKARGRASTILTGGMGIAGAPQVAQKVLLGQ